MARLKKGSAAAKAWGAKMRRLRNPKRKKTSTHKRRKTIKRRKTRPMAKRKVRRRSKTNKIFGLNVTKMLAAGLYGAGSGKISQLLSPLTLKLPFGAISDEVGKYAALEMAKKFFLKQAGVLRDAATIGQHIEMARIGDAVVSGRVNLGFLGGGQTASNGNLF